MNSWQEAAGISAAPKEHMPDCTGVALAEIKDLAPAKKKAEANSSLLPVTAFHKVKAWCWCSAQIGFPLLMLNSVLVSIAHGLCDVAWVSCLVHRAHGSNLSAPGAPQKVVLT